MVVPLENTRDHVVAHLAVLKAGGVCVPVDSSFPESRRAEILRDSGARFILTQAVFDGAGADLPDSNPGISAGPESPAVPHDR